jgi:endonuclease III related protein
MPRPSAKKTARLTAIYDALFEAFGPQHWWPGETPFEVIAGAILTQNTAWSNVEKAIVNLKASRMLSIEAIAEADTSALAESIRPSGYFNQKAARLQSFCRFLINRFQGDLNALFAVDLSELRPLLLAQNGVGPETADSILCYAGDLPAFVVDTYTRRIFSRKRMVSEQVDYERLQKLFTDHLPADVKLYNEYHALIVRLGATLCKKSSPLCDQCPIKGL